MRDHDFDRADLARSRVGDRILVADVHGGEVTIVVLTELEDSKKDGEVWAEQIRRARRGRERRGEG